MTLTSGNTNASSTNTGAITLKSGDAAGATSNSGNITIDVGTATGSAGSITIGRSAVPVTIPGGLKDLGGGANATLSRSGAHTLTLATTANTSLTLPTSGTLTTTADNLSVFSATTSAQLAGVLSDETGSGGGFVRATGPTLASPLISSGLLDANGVNMLSFSPTASAGNYFEMKNSLSTVEPDLAVVGAGANISMNLKVKGTATVRVLSTTAGSDPLYFQPFIGGLNVANAGIITSVDLTAGRTWTFPDADGTVCLTSTCVSATAPTLTGLLTVQDATNDNTNREIAAIKRFRADATAPGAADFGGALTFRLEGFTSGSDVVTASVQGAWDKAQTNDIADRDSYLAFSTMLDNVLAERLRIAANGQVLTTDGSASAPAHSFSADTDTGMYRIGTNILGFAVDGAERLRIDPANSAMTSSLALSFTNATNRSIGVDTSAANTAGRNMILYAGTGGAGTTNGATGGNLQTIAGQGGAAGANSAGGAGGQLQLDGGAGAAGAATNGNGGAGGHVLVTGGTGGAPDGAGTGGNGGNVVLIPGTAGTNGTAGSLKLGNTNATGFKMMQFESGTCNASGANETFSQAFVGTPEVVICTVNSPPGATNVTRSCTGTATGNDTVIIHCREDNNGTITADGASTYSIIVADL